MGTKSDKILVDEENPSRKHWIWPQIFTQVKRGKNYLVEGASAQAVRSALQYHQSRGRFQNLIIIRRGEKGYIRHRINSQNPRSACGGMRSRKELLEAVGRAESIVWWNRNMLLMRKQGIGDPESSSRIEEEVGLEELEETFTDIGWGKALGRLETLRWVLGGEWGEIST